MAFVDGMEKYKEKEKPFLTLRETTITFSMLAVEMLEFSPYVTMYLDRKKHIAAFVPSKKDEFAIPFYKEPKKGKQRLVRLSGKDRVKTLMDVAGITDCGKGKRFYGYYIEDEKTLVVDMAEPFNVGSEIENCE